MLRADRLILEHLQLASTAADLLRHAEARPIDPAGIATARWSLSRQLFAHLAKEDRLLYPLLRRSPDRATAALADRFAAELGGLADRFREYMCRWTAERIARDPDGFERDTRALSMQLDERIRREEAELYRHIPAMQAVATVDVAARGA
ncbi:cation-binding protein [Nostoc sp. 3335mG]|nr:cation-binding protein [Nostoc sp. 3335mG]